MSNEIAVVAAIGLWIAAYLVQRRVAVSPNWLLFDGILAVVIGIVVAARDGVGRGLLAGLVILPLLVLFSALRTVHMRYIERKTQAILDDTPGMRAAYERRNVPSRRDRLADRDGDA